MLTLLAVIVLMTGMWVASLRREDASLVDRVWGMAFVVIAWTAWLDLDAPSARADWALALVTVWGVRLSLYLTWRNWGHGEDRRYARMRQHWGDRFAGVSFWTVFMLQAGLAWAISWPVRTAIMSGSGWTGWDTVGVWVFGAGLAFEAVGDAQLATFKADPANRGAVLDRGLWRYTRHPNYFGDALLWWGLGLLGVGAGAWWTLAGPALMTFFLVRVSGVAMLEKDIGDRRPAYAAYIRRTSAFVPWPPAR